MKILADENFPRPVIDALRRQSHEVKWARKSCPGLGDRALLDLAEEEGRVVITLDKDFWRLALRRSSPLERSGVILFRVLPATAEEIEPLALAALSTPREWTGHLSLVTRAGIEMIRA